MNFEAVIFDLDGTLLDSMDVWEKIDTDFLRKRNLDVPDDYTAVICAMSFAEAAAYTIERFHLAESVPDIVGEWNEMALYEYSHKIGLTPYALPYLEKLKEAGIKLAAATGLPERLYKPCLVHNQIYGMFDALCSTEQVPRGKEYSDIFLAAADCLHVPPQKCLVFEDVLPAVRSAKQAGMLVYGVYDKYSAHHRAQICALADGYLESFQDAPLPEEVKGSEFWDLYDADRNKTGRWQRRTDAVPQGYYHLTVSVWLRGADGNYLLSQRHPAKKYPLFWECTGGCALFGESSLQAAVREVGEELGIRLDPERGTIIYQERRETEQDFYDVWMFELGKDFQLENCVLQKSEVVSTRWASKEQIAGLCRGKMLHPLLHYFQEVLP